MKVIIFTQPLGHNYGGILQALALQYAVKKLGYSPITVKFPYWKPTLKQRIMKIIKDFIKIIIRYHINDIHPWPSARERARVHALLLDFIKKNIIMSEVIETEQDLENLYKANQQAVFIFGSDQVWRPIYSPNINWFFGSFMNERTCRFSYAASFGVDFWEYTKKQTLYYKNLIKSFQAISVREKSGIELCKKYLDVHAEIVPDPAFLPDIDFYKSFFQSNCHTYGLVTYILDETPQKEEIIKAVKNATQLEISSMNPKNSYINKETKALISVNSWLEHIAGAQYIVTDSFHGTLFSILFQKQFIVIENTGRGNARLQDMLSTFKLADRFLSSDNPDISKILSKNIDYQKLSKDVKAFRKKGWTFLKRNLDGRDI